MPPTVPATCCARRCVRNSRSTKRCWRGAQQPSSDEGAVMAGPTGGARQGILSLVIKDKPALYNAYMPFLKNGGVFVPTPRRYFLGDEVFLLLTLPDSTERLPVAGRVAWVTPTGSQGNRAAGIGVQFADTRMARPFAARSRPTSPAPSTPTSRRRRCRERIGVSRGTASATAHRRCRAGCRVGSSCGSRIPAHGFAATRMRASTRRIPRRAVRQGCRCPAPAPSGVRRIPARR